MAASGKLSHRIQSEGAVAPNQRRARLAVVSAPNPISTQVPLTSHDFAFGRKMIFRKRSGRPRSCTKRNPVIPRNTKATSSGTTDTAAVGLAVAQRVESKGATIIAPAAMFFVSR